MADEERTERVAAGYVPPPPVARMVESPDEERGYVPPPPPPPPPPDPVVAAAGDIACDPGNPFYNGGFGTAYECRQRATSELLLGRGFAGVLALGDLQYEDGALWRFQQAFEPSWGRVKPLIRPAVGNHEYQSGAGGYFDYFGAAAGSSRTGYYSFDVGSWHLVALNSNCDVVSCAAGGEQERWLRADLATHPARCTLAFSHHPRYSSGSHGDTDALDALFRALYEANADVMLSGHDHFYERLAPSNADDRGDDVRGIRQFVVGTGGRNHSGDGVVDSQSEVRNSDSFGVLELTLSQGRYGWFFRSEGSSGFSDSGSAGCH